MDALIETWIEKDGWKDGWMHGWKARWSSWDGMMVNERESKMGKGKKGKEREGTGKGRIDRVDE